MGSLCSINDGKNRNAYRLLVQKLEERTHKENQERGGLKQLEWILEI
jgi:hypothetical protein